MSKRPQYWIRLGFPRSTRSTPAARKRLELAARDKLRADFAADGFDMIDISFVCTWADDGVNGVASAYGVEKDD